VACGQLRRVLEPGRPGIFLGTAHPAKFQEILEARLGWKIPLPPALADLDARPIHTRAIPADAVLLKSLLG